MIVQFLHGVQVCIGNTWFNLWLHRWREIGRADCVIPEAGIREYGLCCGWFTLEIEL